LSTSSWRPTRCPTFPHVSLETVGRYTVAKIKEAVLAVTGS
jgi:hypothetical protein